MSTSPRTTQNLVFRLSMSAACLLTKSFNELCLICIFTEFSHEAWNVMWRAPNVGLLASPKGELFWHWVGIDFGRAGPSLWRRPG